MENITCPKCKSEYVLKKMKIPMRDTDSEWCSVCNSTLKSWSKSTTIYSAELKVRKEEHLKTT
ncbi:hypothetical protein [Sutcliffiella sp. NC1]|uniref:hypothetical protein n=1 Tax=Sutcliffiella sp. NC1 TaxID=3004096 RepID=UPI0022DDFA3C|nr:hypothetical protein [Sutcliffiella sp. NC1]WBL16360.1 hypothetical protein O1A01_06935 [Sutcliffiella sp. NC1]